MPPTTDPVILKDQQEFQIRFKQAKDKAQNPVPFAGPLTITPSDATAFLITPDPSDPALFTVKAVPAPGHLGVFFLDCSDTVITKRVPVTVQGGDEADIDLEIGAPVDSAPDTTTPEAPPQTSDQGTNPVTVGDTETEPAGGE